MPCAAGVDFLYNDTTITYPRVGARRLLVLVHGELPVGHLQQRRVHPDLRRPGGGPDEPQPRPLRAGRVARRLAPDPERRPALRPAVPRDRRHRLEQRLAPPRVRVDARGLPAHGGPRQRGAVLRPGAPARPRQRDPLRGQHHRPVAAPADQRQPLAHPGRGAALPEHPARAGALGHPGQLHHHGPADAERELAPGQRGDRAAARVRHHRERRLPVPAGLRPHHLDQPERAFVRRRPGATTAAVRIRPTPTTASTPRRPGRATTASTCPCSNGRPDGATTGSATPCRRA